jgi:Putative zinc-finger
MNCAEFEVLLADYLDNTLPAPERAALQQHASSCVSCLELLKDASGALGFLQRAEEVVFPAELVTRIAYQAPAGRIRDPFERQGFFSRLIGRWLRPVLQPRLVMGMAMTILSFAMLERCTGVRVQQIQAADLNPVRIWGGVEDRAVRLKDRAVKYYENLRWVYEIEVRLRSLQDQSEAMPEQTDGKSDGGKTQDTTHPGGGTARSQGEMNGDKK